MRILQPGELEELKLGVHAAAFGLAAVMLAYNVGAMVQRRKVDVQHIANTAFYVVVLEWERRNVRHHARRIKWSSRAEN